MLKIAAWYRNLRSWQTNRWITRLDVQIGKRKYAGLVFLFLFLSSLVSLSSLPFYLLSPLISKLYTYSRFYTLLSILSTLLIYVVVVSRYKQTWGWNDSMKFNELKDDDAKFLVAYDRTTKQPKAFMHFRWVREEEKRKKKSCNKVSKGG